MLSPADLPNDIDTLKALLLASERLVRERGQQLASMAEQLNTHAVEIEHLKLQIAKLRRMQFGRKSEKLDHQIEQLELQVEDLQADEAAAAREVPAADQAPRNRYGDPCPSICHATKKYMRQQSMPAQPAVAAWGSWAKTWRNSWSSCRPASAWSDMCAPNWRAAAAMPSSRRLRRAVRSSAASPVPVCSRTSWWRSSPTICRCTGSP